MKKVFLLATAILIFTVLCSGCANSNTESILTSNENDSVNNIATLCSGCANSNTESILTSNENDSVNNIATIVSESGYDSTEKIVFVFPEYINKGIYDNQVQSVEPNTQGPPETYEEIMGDKSENEKIDSLYKIVISRVLDDEEAKTLTGWSKGYGDHNCVFYEGNIVYDYLNKSEINKTVIFRMPGTIQMQREKQPPYASGDTVAIVLQKKEDTSDITRLFKSYAFVYDVIEMNGNEFFAVRGQNVKELENGLNNLMSENETSYITTTTDNPVVYFGIYDSSELSDSLSVLWNEMKN